MIYNYMAIKTKNDAMHRDSIVNILLGWQMLISRILSPHFTISTQRKY